MSKLQEAGHRRRHSGTLSAVQSQWMRYLVRRVAWWQVDRGIKIVPAVAVAVASQSPVPSVFEVASSIVGVRRNPKSPLNLPFPLSGGLMTEGQLTTCRTSLLQCKTVMAGHEFLAYLRVYRHRSCLLCQICVSMHALLKIRQFRSKPYLFFTPSAHPDSTLTWVTWQPHLGGMEPIDGQWANHWIKHDLPLPFPLYLRDGSAPQGKVMQQNLLLRPGILRGRRHLSIQDFAEVGGTSAEAYNVETRVHLRTGIRKRRDEDSVKHK